MAWHGLEFCWHDMAWHGAARTCMAWRILFPHEPWHQHRMAWHDMACSDMAWHVMAGQLRACPPPHAFPSLWLFLCRSYTPEGLEVLKGKSKTVSNLGRERGQMGMAGAAAPWQTPRAACRRPS